MKIIISGGGTGGHIYPAVTIAKHIQRQCPEAEIVFVGTREGLERDIVPRYGFRLEFVEVSGFSRKLGLDTFKSLYKLCRGLLDAFRLFGAGILYSLGFIQNDHIPGDFLQPMDPAQHSIGSYVDPGVNLFRFCQAVFGLGMN